MKSIQHGAKILAAAAMMQLASWSGYADPSGMEEPTVTAKRSQHVRTVRVSYADLKLTSAAGVETLHGRIRGAVDEVCGDYADIRDLRGTRSLRDCREFAWDYAMAQVDDATSEIRVAAR